MAVDSRQTTAGTPLIIYEPLATNTRPISGINHET